MGVGTKLFSAPSIASFSITSNPSQKRFVGGVFSLGVGLFFFFVDVVLLPPLLFSPCGGEFASITTKFGLAVRSLATPLFPSCLVILSLQVLPHIEVILLCLVSLSRWFE